MAVLPLFGFRNVYRESRIVILPDYQGVGIGAKLSAYVAALYERQGKRYRSTTSHPGFIAHRNKSKIWMLVQQSKTGNTSQSGKVGKKYNVQASAGRSVVTFEYVGDRQEYAEEVAHG